MAGDTWENGSGVGNAGADAEGVTLSTFFDEGDTSNAVATDFIKGFKEYLVANGQDEIIPAVSALGYDAYLAAVKAIETAGSTDPVAIRDALKGVEFEGVTGAISFDAVSYTHLRAHETRHDLVCRLLLENKKEYRIMSQDSNHTGNAL